MFTIYGNLIKQCPCCNGFVKADQTKCNQCNSLFQEPHTMTKVLKPTELVETEASMGSNPQKSQSNPTI